LSFGAPPFPQQLISRAPLFLVGFLSSSPLLSPPPLTFPGESPDTSHTSRSGKFSPTFQFSPTFPCNPNTTAPLPISNNPFPPHAELPAITPLPLPPLHAVYPTGRPSPLVPMPGRTNNWCLCDHIYSFPSQFAVFQ